MSQFKKKLQVFVSSTYTDLKEDRQAAVSAILKAGHIPAGMELFTAGNKSQLDTINRWIDQCDVYMLILGGRYGSIEPTTNVSYTELEYDYAVQQGKPYFAVVIDDDALESRVKVNGTSVIENENPKQLRQFREKVLLQISSFFSDQKDIRLAVHESIGDLMQSEDLSGWVSGSDIPDVTELQNELSKLRKENEALTLNLKETKLNTDKGSVPDFLKLEKILESTEVTVPAFEEFDTSEYKSTALELFINNADTLVSGVSNTYDANEAISFLYFNLCAKLKIHGLIENEKVAGVKWRRSSVSKKGLDFLAWVAERKSEANK